MNNASSLSRASHGLNPARPGLTEPDRFDERSPSSARRFSSNRATRPLTPASAMSFIARAAPRSDPTPSSRPSISISEYARPLSQLGPDPLKRRPKGRKRSPFCKKAVQLDSRDIPRPLHAGNGTRRGGQARRRHTAAAARHRKLTPRMRAYKQSRRRPERARQVRGSPCPVLSKAVEL